MTKKQIKELQKIAEASDSTLDDLATEMEFGTNVKKPFTIAVSFDRLADLVKFSEVLTDSLGGEVAVYKADVLDKEYGGNVTDNHFVIRSIDGYHGKPDEWRVTSNSFRGDK